MTVCNDPTAGEMLKILGVRLPPQHAAPQRNVEVTMIRFAETLARAGWSSPAARSRGMKLLKEATLRGALTLDDTAFGKQLAATVIRNIVGPAATAAAPAHPIEDHRLAIVESASRCQEAGSVHACSDLYFKITFSLISKDPIDPSLSNRLRSLVSALQLAMKMVLRTHDIAQDSAALDDALAMAIAIASLCGSENFNRDKALGLLANTCAALLSGQASATSVVSILAA